MKRMLIVLTAIVVIFPLDAQARRGACDGFNRCRCGVTAARQHNLPLSYNGHNLKLAREWARAFPRTSFRPGVAAVKPHHVLTVVGGADCRTATVRDEKGTYQRNVCGMTFVDPNGNGMTGSQSKRQRHTVADGAWSWSY